MSMRSVKVSNISSDATEQDLREFLTFPGKIEHVEMESDKGSSKVAYVTFSTPDGAETAVLLSGAVVCGQSLNIELAKDYALPTSTASPTSNAESGESGMRKAEDVVSSMLAKGFILGKDALNRAKSFDERHRLTSTASAKVASLDQKVGFTEKISAGTVIVNDKVKEMDEKFQVSEKTKTAISAAEQSVSSAGSAIMKNRYVLTGATWVTGAYNRVARKAEEVGQKTKEKVLAQNNQGKTEEGHVHTSMSEPTTTDQTSKQATTVNEPSKPEPQQATTVDPPSKSETQQATTVNEPSKPEPQVATIINESSKPEPQVATTVNEPSKPEPQQLTKDGQSASPAKSSA
ncbi:binding partner of ACD11 1-like isoform X2 [Vigna umbellata]|uniref:binding partner of ACD11 1-like isoform X1 n=1 Tax=Vigna umbellata TaxID=87088 RepID=UPI001F5E39D2|nr:binding partner of ACD11 1-like isoform X1 [Vigna umbellata]XP_047170728.1 binding partner of ACD11 1-like isoform X2 [Vigna umbellata]